MEESHVKRPEVYPFQVTGDHLLDSDVVSLVGYHRNLAAHESLVLMVGQVLDQEVIHGAHHTGVVIVRITGQLSVDNVLDEVFTTQSQ
ncbi:hypothetical protein D3C87_1814120 [compost metagenome]